MPISSYFNPYNRRPYFYNNYRNNYIPNYNYQNMQHITPKPSPPPQAICSETSSPSTPNRSTSSDNEDVWLDLFGIKLYFDDVLILSLLFFLYKEEVKDEGLFLALVLLLIS